MDVDVKQAAVSLELAVEAVRGVLSPRRRDAVLLTPEVRFEDLGFSSLDVAEVFVRLEEIVGHPLDTTHIGQTRTIGDLLRVDISVGRAW